MFEAIWFLSAIILGSCLAGFPFMVKFVKEKEDITLFILIFCLVFGWLGFLIFVSDVVSWVKLKSGRISHFKIPNPVIFKKR